MGSPTPAVGPGREPMCRVGSWQPGTCRALCWLRTLAGIPMTFEEPQWLELRSLPRRVSR